ncbi:hypothetical protein [Williamsia deligens]|uniref:Cation-transporting P-type ATPase C-terminal domain-containing protein n=1 Tax=Williamsia deligens TaxID=321325 RepID=A0ABW3GAV7_9NOCA|nr:hypothetical protein [Williamsia deligens]
MAALVVAALAVAIRFGGRRLPAGDWPFGFDVAARTRGGDVEQVPAGVRATQSAFLRGPLVEKIVLVSMLLLIFSRILPGVRASTTQIIVTVAILVVANSVVSHHIAGRGVEWTSTVSQFIAVAAINAGVVVVLTLLPTPGGPAVQPIPSLFFLLLISLIVTLYDRYRMLRILRRGRAFPIWAVRRRLLVRSRTSVRVD